jgi:hypothetical protein
MVLGILILMKAGFFILKYLFFYKFGNQYIFWTKLNSCNLH